MGEAVSFGAGAALVHDADAWVYIPNAPRGSLGAAVTWAIAQGANQVQFLVDGAATNEAFSAQGFSEPAPQVWSVTGRSISMASAQTPVVEPAPACPEQMAVLREAGLDVVIDHGVWIGELNGLELARVGHRDGVCSIDIGVGAYDQFASSALAGDRDPAEALATVVDMVSPHRVPGAAPHPMGRLVRSRWLRAQAVRAPDQFGLDRLDPIPLLEPRPGLMESQPAAALGHRGDETVLAVFSVGLDLGVAETAAGLVAMHQPASAIIAMPQRDQHPRIIDAAGLLACPTKVVPMNGEWSD